MFNLDAVTTKNDNKNWPYRMLITGPSGSGKTNALLNLIEKDNNNKVIDKIYFYAKDLEELKYQPLINKHENAGVKNLNDPNAFIEYSNIMDDVYENIDDYNLRRKRKGLIVFDEMIANIMTNKKFQATIKKLFIRCRKLNISVVFISQSYFFVPKEVRLNSTHYLIMRIYNKRELQQIVIDHIAYIDYRNFLKIYRNCAKEPYSFLTINIRLPADNLLTFRKNFSDSPL